MRRDLAPMGPVAMLEEVEPLPGPEPHPTLGHRDLEAGREQGRLDVGGHVVGTFLGVFQIGHGGIVAWRDKAMKERAEIRSNVGIGVFLDEQRTRGMAQKQCHDAVAGRQVVKPVGKFI